MRCPAANPEEEDGAAGWSRGTHMRAGSSTAARSTPAPRYTPPAVSLAAPPFLSYSLTASLGLCTTELQRNAPLECRLVMFAHSLFI